MKFVPRKRYTAEFRAQAIELVRMGKPVKEVAEDLEVGVSLLYGWVQRAAQPAPRQSQELEAVGEESAAVELRRLRREVANLQLENTILKKAAVILGTHPPQTPAR